MGKVTLDGFTSDWMIEAVERAAEIAGVSLRSLTFEEAEAILVERAHFDAETGEDQTQ